MKRFARMLDSCVSLVTGLLAALLLFYSCYVLYDSFVISRSAFSSKDLLQYKPSLQVENEKLGFRDLLAINPDVVGWLTIYDTNIDYPVLQGRDNMEYINKNLYGKFSLAGSIYLSAENQKTLTDSYNLIYGHNFYESGTDVLQRHQATGGAMFGDVPRFRDREYFDGHRTGLYQTAAGENYDLTVFACIETDAYESLIYSGSGREQADDPVFLDFVRRNAVQLDLPAGTKLSKLVALSTCAITETNGRVVLLAYATPHEGEIAEPEDEKTEAAVRRRATGNGSREGKWSLLNLACAVLTLGTLLPLGSLRRKGKLLKRKRWIGVLLEAVLTLAAVLLFLRTQTLGLEAGVLDRWTPVMILIFAAALLTDCVSFRRGREA